MVSSRKEPGSKPQRRRPPATTPEGRELELIALAVDLAEKQLREGTASAQVQVHYLKLATSRNRLEEKRLENENALMKARVSQIESNKASEELFTNAINAMKAYSPHSSDDEEDDYYD